MSGARMTTEWALGMLDTEPALAVRAIAADMLEDARARGAWRPGFQESVARWLADVAKRALDAGCNGPCCTDNAAIDVARAYVEANR